MSIIPILPDQVITTRMKTGTSFISDILPVSTDTSIRLLRENSEKAVSFVDEAKNS